ncbi:hypothetical protein DSO57_1013514 [Entomophthora muscae]|uniref:Uncharacterized protein n=1 Tax=Entomophthora muscae TaxID=34485 RepID=A0ACC2TGR5_9FUNG|nr:hypothetical protein DSO57_1013514 [Entomophthora muscae]
MSENVLITKQAPTATTQVSATTAHMPAATVKEFAITHPVSLCTLCHRKGVRYQITHLPIPTSHPVSQLPPTHLHQLASPPPLPGEIVKLGNQKRQLPQISIWRKLLSILGIIPKQKGIKGSSTPKFMAPHSVNEFGCMKIGPNFCQTHFSFLAVAQPELIGFNQ